MRSTLWTLIVYPAEPKGSIAALRTFPKTHPELTKINRDQFNKVV